MAKKKKPDRGCGIVITLPTEPLAGASKDTGIMAVKVEDKGEFLTEYDIPEGQSIEFRVGGDVIAYMQRVGPAPDGHMYFDADQDNVDEITIDFEHALSGPQTITLTPGQRSEIKPVVSRHWKITAPRWE